MILFVSDAFVEQYQGGAEFTTEAIIEGSYYPVNKLLSTQTTVEIMEKHKDSYWKLLDVREAAREISGYISFLVR